MARLQYAVPGTDHALAFRCYETSRIPHDVGEARLNKGVCFRVGALVNTVCTSRWG